MRLFIEFLLIFQICSLIQRDDILLGVDTIEEHDKILEKVLQRVQDYGITFKLEKC